MGSRLIRQGVLGLLLVSGCGEQSSFKQSEVGSSPKLLVRQTGDSVSVNQPKAESSAHSMATLPARATQNSAPIGDSNAKKLLPLLNQTPSASPTAAAETKKSSASPPIAENGFVIKGKSLDLHVIMDVSVSLSTDMSGEIGGKPYFIAATDPNCLRFSALKIFFDSIKSTLGENANARLSLTVFSSEARFVGIDEQFLKKTNEQFEREYRRVICNTEGLTNAKEAFDLTLAQAKKIENPKEVRTVLLFTDGMPTLHTKADTIESARQLRDFFQGRLYGVFLGTTSSTSEFNFMKSVTDSGERVRVVSKVDDLAKSLQSLLD